MFYQYLKKLSPLSLIFFTFIGMFGLLNLSNFVKSFEDVSAEEHGTLQETFLEIEAQYNNKFQAKEAFVNFNGAMSRLFASRELNGVVRFDNGSFLRMEEEINTEPLENAIQFFEELSSMGYPFIYIQAPTLPLQDNDPLIPAGFVTYTNKNIDSVLEGMEQAGIVTYDLRETMLTEGLNPYEAFYKTDHHWTFETAHWAHAQVGSWIDQAIGENILNREYFNLALFHKEIQKDAFLGSHGQRTGAHFTGYDDFSFITPLFYTDLRVEIPSLDLDISGSFEEVFLPSADTENLDYGMYLFGDRAYTKVTNHLVDNEVKLLFIKDSFTPPMASFLALHYKEIHLIDLRFTENAGKVFEIIEEIDPDLVVEQFASIKLLEGSSL